MNFYHQLDAIMKQDMGGRGLLASLPENPIKKAAESLRHAALQNLNFLKQNAYNRKCRFS